MPNPADDLVELTETRSPSQNREGITRIKNLLEFLRSRFKKIAIIKSIDGSDGGAYTVDIYETFNTTTEIVDIKAVAIDYPLMYDLHTPCQVVELEENQYGIVRPTRVFYFRITNDTYDAIHKSNFVKGIPCTSTGLTILTDSLSLDIQYTYPDNRLLSIYEDIPQPGTVVPVMIYDIPLLYSAANSIAQTTTVGLIISHTGSNFPIGQYKGMKYGNVTQDQSGHEFVSTHGTVL